MKKFISLFLSVILTLSLIGTTACAEQKESYTQIFEKDKVIDVELDIDEADLADMSDYARNEEYHAADITVDGVKVENVGIRTKGNMTLNSVTSSDSDMPSAAANRAGRWTASAMGRPSPERPSTRIVWFASGGTTGS